MNLIPCLRRAGVKSSLAGTILILTVLQPDCCQTTGFLGLLCHLLGWAFFVLVPSCGSPRAGQHLVPAGRGRGHRAPSQLLGARHWRSPGIRNVRRKGTSIWCFVKAPRASFNPLHILGAVITLELREMKLRECSKQHAQSATAD